MEHDSKAPEADKPAPCFESFLGNIKKQVAASQKQHLLKNQGNAVPKITGDVGQTRIYMTEINVKLIFFDGIFPHPGSQKYNILKLLNIIYEFIGMEFADFDSGINANLPR